MVRGEKQDDCIKPHWRPSGGKSAQSKNSGTCVRTGAIYWHQIQLMERKINARSGAIYAGQASVEARNPQSSPDLLAIGCRRPSGQWSHFSNQNIHKALPLPMWSPGNSRGHRCPYVSLNKKDGTFKIQNALLYSSLDIFDTCLHDHVLSNLHSGTPSRGPSFSHKSDLWRV